MSRRRTLLCSPDGMLRPDPPAAPGNVTGDADDPVGHGLMLIVDHVSWLVSIGSPTRHFSEGPSQTLHFSSVGRGSGRLALDAATHERR
jgi:hypothetical protein